MGLGHEVGGWRGWDPHMPKMISYGTSVTAFGVMMSVGRESPKHRRDMGWGHTHNPSQHPHPEHPGYSPWLLVLAQEINYSLGTTTLPVLSHMELLCTIITPAGFRLQVLGSAGSPSLTGSAVCTIRHRYSTLCI